SKFYKTQVVFDLSSFQLERTDKKWFESNRIMRNLAELDSDIDSINRELLTQELNHYLYQSTYFTYFNKDSIRMPVFLQEFKRVRDSLNMLKYRPKDEERAQDLVTARVDKTQSADTATKPAPAAPTAKKKRPATSGARASRPAITEFNPPVPAVAKPTAR